MTSLPIVSDDVISPYGSDDSVIDELFAILDQGDRELDFYGMTDFIVLLGMSGAGKSTLAHYMSGDLNTLIGVYKKGDLIYEDLDGKISTSNIISKTLFPEATVDGDQAVVDTPGFQDTRNASFEIAASYFTKKVFDNSTNLKLAMVIPITAFKAGERYQLDFMMKSMVTLVKYIDKYADCFTLVVTKVPIRQHDDFKEIGFIKEFLEEARDDYKQKLQEATNEDDKQELTNILKIVDILLDDRFEKISVLRQPEREGPISQSEYSLKNRDNIRHVVFDTVKYVASEPDDVAYPLSTKTENFIRETIYGEINNRVSDLLKGISSATVKTLQLKGDSGDSILQIRDYVCEAFIVTLSVDIIITTRDKFEDYVESNMEFLHKNTRYRGSAKSFQYLLRQFDFFRSFTDKIDEPIETWMNVFTNSRTFTQYVNNWYVTITSMYEVAGTSSVQKTKNTKFQPIFLNATYYLVENGIDEFLYDIKISELTSYPDQLTELMKDNHKLFKPFILRDANSITKLIQPNITCSDETMYVRSNFVSLFSDVVSQIENNICTTVTVINVIAFEKVFVDTNVNFLDTDISIIGMDWEVNTAIKIDVSGGPGVDRVPPQAQQSNSMQQYNGLVGLPGKQGGYVVSIAYQVNDKALLEIISYGGKGGRAQIGGNGNIVPANVDFPADKFFDSEKDMVNNFCDKYQFTCIKLDHYPEFDRWSAEDMYKKTEQLPGAGGKRGKGGFSGNLESIILSTGTEFNNDTRSGDYSESVSGGSGWKLSYSMTRCSNSYVFPYWYYECTRYVHNPKHQITGNNEVGTQIEPVPRKNPFKTINDITDYKISILVTRFLHTENEFLKTLITDEYILKHYDILALIDEFTMVESNKNKMNAVLLEEYLSETMQVLKEWDTANNDEEQVMTFLISTMSSMLWNLRAANETVFVVNLHEYVDTTLTSIAELEKLGVIQTVENIKNTYSKSMDQNILEAQNYITIFITEEFENIFSGIQVSVTNLVTEVLELKQEAELQHAKLKEKERQLRNNMLGHCIFGVINVAAAAISLMGPVGSAAGLALGAASGIAESIVISDVTIDPNDILSLPNGIYNLLNDMKELRQSRQLGHMEVLVYTCDSYLSVPSITADDKKKVGEIKETALTLKTIQNIEDIRKIIDSSIKDLESISKNLKPGENLELARMLNNTNNILDYAKKTSQIAGPLLDALKNYKNDQNKLEIVISMIEANEQAMNDLSDFQEGIYEIIVPMLDQFHDDMSTLEDELGNKTRVSLVVKRWEVSNMIRKMRNLIQRYTEGFKEEKKFLEYFNQLDEAASLVVTLFELIQYYQEHKEFAEYIAMLNQVGGGNIPPASGFYVQLVALKASMLANTVRANCNTVISSFVQQVFPFAHFHLGSLADLDGNYCEGSQFTVTNTINTVKTEMAKIRDIILGEKDEYVHVGYFDSSYVSSFPFAMWYNYTDGDVINRLMKGEEVVLFAPIVGKKNAVKFNKAVIRFTRTDGGSQEELEQDLKSFTMEQTHFGNSLYQCDGVQFIIRSRPLRFSYTLEYDNNGNPIISNNVYDKIRKGDISLSPYTMWRLKLQKTYQYSPDFSALSKYTHNNINLELYGKGQFVEKEVSVCKTELENYYDVYDPMVFIE